MVSMQESTNRDLKFSVRGNGVKAILAFVLTLWALPLFSSAYVVGDLINLNAFIIGTSTLSTANIVSAQGDPTDCSVTYPQQFGYVYKDQYPATTTLISSGSTFNGSLCDYFGSDFEVDLTLIEGNGVGYYYRAHHIGSLGGGNDYYWQFYFDGETWTKIDPEYLFTNPELETQFTDLVITATTTGMQFDIEYFLNLSEVDYNRPERNPQYIALEYIEVGTTTTALITTDSVLVHGTSTVQIEIPINSLSASSTYTYMVKFYNLQSAFDGTEVFPEVYMYGDFSTDYAKGILATSTIELYKDSDDDLDLLECSPLNPYACFVKFTLWLVVPDDLGTILDNANLEDELEMVIPFSYMYELDDMWDTFESQTPTSTSDVTIPFGTSSITVFSLTSFPSGLDGLISQVRNLIGYGLWVVFAVAYFVRFQRIFNVGNKITTGHI